MKISAIERSIKKGISHLKFNRHFGILSRALKLLDSSETRIVILFSRYRIEELNREKNRIEILHASNRSRPSKSDSSIDLKVKKILIVKKRDFTTYY